MKEPVRVRYIRQRDGCRSFVIADLGPGDREDFAEQEPGEVVWRTFRPSASERGFAYYLLCAGKGDSWSHVIDL